MFTSVIQVILILWFATPCESDVCSQNICQCTKFGRTRLIVKCRVRGYLSAGIPSNTVELDLSSCSLSSITEDIFRNLTVLKKLDLSKNSVRHIPQNTFRNMEKLEIIDLSKNSLRHIPQNTFRNMEKLEIMKIGDNLLSIADVKVVLKGLTRLHRLHLDRNPLGPSLPSDIFTGFENMTYLSLIGCNLQKIENGSFRAMRHLQVLDLSSNKLTHIHKGTVQGLTDQLSVLYLQGNELETIGDGTLNQFNNLQRCWLDNNKLTSVPDLTGPKTLSSLNLQENQITDLSSIATSGIGHVYNLLLSNNRIDHLPPNIFNNTLVIWSLDLSFNKLKSLPDGIFNGLDQLNILVLTFNNITHINRRTFSGLSSLTTLLLIKNKLTFIAKDVFDETPSLKSLFLHSNAITNIEKETFDRLDLSQLTIFDNPLNSLPDGIFDGMANGTQVALTCKNLRQLPLDKYVSKIECAPTTSLHVILDHYQSIFSSCFTRSGFVCHDCTSREKHSAPIYCANCSLCPVGTYSCTDGSRCLPCPAGGFYQDEMGQDDCKRCSIGTFIRMKWDKMIAKDAALVHLFLNSEVLGLQLPTAWKRNSTCEVNLAVRYLQADPMFQVPSSGSITSQE